MLAHSRLIYDRVVNMRNNMGSDEVLRSVIAKTWSRERKRLRHLARLPYPVVEDTRLQDENRRLQDENRTLMSKINDLEARIRQLEAGLSANPECRSKARCRWT